MKNRSKEIVTWGLTWSCLAVALALSFTIVWSYKFTFVNAAQEQEITIASVRLALILAVISILGLVWARKTMQTRSSTFNHLASQVSCRVSYLFFIVLCACLLSFITTQAIFQASLTEAFATWSNLGANFDIRAYFWIQNLPLIYERLPISNLPLLLSEIWLIILFITLRKSKDA